MHPPYETLSRACYALNHLWACDIDLPLEIHALEPAYCFGGRAYLGSTTRIVGYDEENELHFDMRAHPEPFEVRVRRDPDSARLSLRLSPHRGERYILSVDGAANYEIHIEDGRPVVTARGHAMGMRDVQEAHTLPVLCDALNALPTTGDTPGVEIATFGGPEVIGAISWDLSHAIYYYADAPHYRMEER